MRISLGRPCIAVIGFAFSLIGMDGRPLAQEPAQRFQFLGEVRQIREKYKVWGPTTPNPVFMSGPTPCAPVAWTDPGSHRNYFVNVYVNASAREQYVRIKQDRGTFPEGTVIVKEKLKGAADRQATELGIMVKRAKGSLPASKDWQYFFVAKDGEVVWGERLNNCVQCHTPARPDAVFGHPVNSF